MRARGEYSRAGVALVALGSFVLPFVLGLASSGPMHLADPQVIELAVEGALLRREVAEVRAELDRVRADIARAQASIERSVGDVANLAIVGGPRQRYRDGVECSGGLYLEGSPGERARRGLDLSGWCRAQALPLPAPGAALLAGDAGSVPGGELAAGR